MGKNKKWKRKAKRLLGHCLAKKCDECEYYNYELVTPFDVELEKEFYGKNEV